MKFLKTFFGQALRKADSDFDQQASRDGAVLTNIDYTHSKGGVVNLPGSDIGYEGLNVYKASDERSVYVTPGIFYTNGAFNETNGLGGGERGQLFTQTTFTHLPYTPPLSDGQSSYLVVYIKTIDVNYNPDPARSSAIVTSKDVITGENIPSRAYTTGYLVVSNPMAYSQIKDLGGIPLAVLTTAQDGTITFFDPTIRRGYQIASSVDLMLDQIVDIGVPDEFFSTDMFGDSSITDDKFADSMAVSSEIAKWDGVSTSAISGSGVATEHIKNGAVYLSKISITGSLGGFSSRNYLTNSSFESSGAEIPSWETYNPSTSASTAVVDTSKYYGSKSARIQGIILGQNPPESQVISLYQDVSFTGNAINGRDVGAYFYLKTDEDIPMSGLSNGVSGTTGIHGVIEFMSNGTVVGDPNIFASYTGVATDWTKLQTSETLLYTGNSIVDSIRFSISGSIGKVNAYVDGAFLGLTSILPEWTPNPNDFSFGDTLNINGVNVFSNLSVGNVTSDNIASASGKVGSLIPNAPSSVDIGSPAEAFGSINSNEVIVDGNPLRLGSRSINYINDGQFIVPPTVTSVIAELYGGGAGGSNGAPNAVTFYGWGGPGGQGGWAARTELTVEPGDVLNIIVGSGGAGGQAGLSPQSAAGGASKILDSDMNEIIKAKGGVGNNGAVGVGGLGAQNPAYVASLGPLWETVSGNTIYVQGTFGASGFGQYAQTGNPPSYVTPSGESFSGGQGGSLAAGNIPSIGGRPGFYFRLGGYSNGLTDAERCAILGYAGSGVCTSSNPQVNRESGYDGIGYGAGGGGGAGGKYLYSAGGPGSGGNGTQGLVRISW